MVAVAGVPGLAHGELLVRKTTLPRRADAAGARRVGPGEGTATEAGQRDSPLGAVAGATLGEVRAVPAARVRQLEAEGIPASAIVA